MKELSYRFVPATDLSVNNIALRIGLALFLDKTGVLDFDSPLRCCDCREEGHQTILVVGAYCTSYLQVVVLCYCILGTHIRSVGYSILCTELPIADYVEDN